ncbi:MAG: phospho-N-acetylmuramoyl-pentapeptide-transferase, partial [Chloroflexota bacterium]|nr:phospho-N-acetylmuramoyl-pentapeptide-transferase [Chloroflexota bacterium]
MIANLPSPTLLATSIMPTEPDENMAVSLALAGLAFMLTIIVGRPLVTFLRQRKIGKQVRIDGPKTQLYKTGTPTMGGLMISFVVVLITAIFNLYGRFSMFLPIGILLAAGVLGAID